MSQNVSNELIYHYNIHDLLEVKSSFDDYISKCFLSHTDTPAPDVILKVANSNDLFDSDHYLQIAPGLFYSDEQDSIVSTFKLLNLKFSWKLKGLSARPTEISLSPAYEAVSRRLLKVPVSTVFPVYHYIKLVLQLQLLSKDRAFIIGSCFKPSKSKESLILSASGSMGKTRTVLDLVEQIGGEFLSDDTLIVDKDKILAYPTPVRVRKRGWEVLSREKYISEASLLDTCGTWQKPQTVGGLFFLESGAPVSGICHISHEQALNRLLAINRKTLPYYMERTVLAYAYMNPSFSLNKLMQKEEDILNCFLKDVDCFTLRCEGDDKRQYTRMLHDLIQESS